MKQEKIVIAFGTFDHFHAGHESHLKQAKALGDYLIVVIALDDTVSKIKEEPADNNERERLKAVEESGIADKVILGYPNDKHKVIRKYKPDIIALGYDQFAFTYSLQKTIIDLGLNSEIVRTKAYEPETFKSSIIKQKKRQNEQNS